jgi:hypothetical protein
LSGITRGTATASTGGGTAITVVGGGGAAAVAVPAGIVVAGTAAITLTTYDAYLGISTVNLWRENAKAEAIIRQEEEKLSQLQQARRGKFLFEDEYLDSEGNVWNEKGELVRDKYGRTRAQCSNDRRTTRDIRNLPGRATGGETLPTISGRWLRGTDGNAGRMPKQIADQLRGRQFNRFDDFQDAFWRAIGADPLLSSQFTEGNQTLMREGKAPFVGESQVTGEGFAQQVYNLHHITSINDGGGVYDLDNIMIVSPRYHNSLH